MSRRSTVEWSTILMEFGASGQSRAEFAATRGIPLGTMDYQMARQRRLAAELPRRSPAFVEVARAPLSSASSPLQVEIRIGDFVRVSASSWPSPSWLLALLAEQRSVGC
jgi:hypothetical protein